MSKELPPLMKLKTCPFGERTRCINIYEVQKQTHPPTPPQMPPKENATLSTFGGGDVDGMLLEQSFQFSLDIQTHEFTAALGLPPRLGFPMVRVHPTNGSKPPSTLETTSGKPTQVGDGGKKPL